MSYRPLRPLCTHVYIREYEADKTIATEMKELDVSEVSIENRLHLLYNQTSSRYGLDRTLLVTSNKVAKILQLPRSTIE